MWNVIKSWPNAFCGSALMGDVVKIKSWRKQRDSGTTLCKEGHHKWQLLNERRFDVKQGKLVSAERCTRCGVERNKLT